MAERLVLQGKLDLGKAGELHAQLLGAGKGDIVLDLEGVTLFGALCTQIVLAAGRATQARGATLEIVNASEAVLTQLTCMGLTLENLAEGTA